MINQGMRQRRDFHNVVFGHCFVFTERLPERLLYVFVFYFVCKHLGEGAGGEVGLFSVDSSDPPIVSGPLLGEQYPGCGRHNTFKSWRWHI